MLVRVFCTWLPCFSLRWIHRDFFVTSARTGIARRASFEKHFGSGTDAADCTEPFVRQYRFIDISPESHWHPDMSICTKRVFLHPLILASIVRVTQSTTWRLLESTKNQYYSTKTADAHKNFPPAAFPVELIGNSGRTKSGLGQYESRSRYWCWRKDHRSPDLWPLGPHAW